MDFGSFVLYEPSRVLYYVSYDCRANAMLTEVKTGKVLNSIKLADCDILASGPLTDAEWQKLCMYPDHFTLVLPDRINALLV